MLRLQKQSIQKQKKAWSKAVHIAQFQPLLHDLSSILCYYVPHYLFPLDLHFITALDRLNFEDKLGFLNTFIRSYLVQRLFSLSCAPFVTEIGRDVTKVCTLWELKELFKEAECHSNEMDFCHKFPWSSIKLKKMKNLPFNTNSSPRRLSYTSAIMVVRWK